MKRLSIVGLMLASAFALTNCSQEIVPPIQENDVIVDESIKEDTTPEEVVSIPFEVYANPSAETKTSHDSANNGTKWEAKDEINVYHSVHGENSYTNNHKFTIADVDKGLFGGGLAEPLASGTYDWCFLYPYDDSRGNTTTTTVQIGATKGTDGAYVQRLTNGAGSKEHIAGTLFPMYGHASGISADQNPKVQMRHMSAIVALKVVNQGDSKKENLEQEKNDTDKRDIVINDITFAVPAYSTSAISQTAIPIVGSFNVDPTNDINSASFTPVTGASSNSVTLEFASTTIKPGESATFYLAVRPFDVSNSELGGSEKRTGLTLSITINGSTRSVEIPADTKFEAGKVTTLRVPVKLSYPKVSDALSITSNGRLSDDIAENIITLCEPIYNNINGENTPIYVVGSEGSKGTITIKGFAKDMINALPIGFYASCWNDKLTAMTIKAITADIPEYEEHSLYIPFVGTIGYTDYYIIKGRVPMSEKYGALAGILGWNFDNGISRDLIVNTLGIGASTITFNGIVPNGDFNSKNVVMLDENPVYKEVSEQKVEEYLKKFGSNATLQGLRDILNADFSDENDVDDNGVRYIPWTNAAKLTGEAIFSKIKGIIAEKAGDYAAGQALNIVGFKNYEALMYKLRDMKFQLVIETYPYAPTYTTETPETTLQPIVFWGFDANVNN